VRATRDRRPVAASLAAGDAKLGDPSRECLELTRSNVLGVPSLAG